MTQTLAELAPEYRRLFLAMEPNPASAATILAAARRLDSHMATYRSVTAATGVPASLIAVIHLRESDGDFTAHLHNGDPLSMRTQHVPAGRPPGGTPPFTWAESAIDALHYEGLVGLEWTLEQALFQLERYNGFGYRNRGLHSPYLWGSTNQQQAGKYTSDGHFDPSAWDVQLGAAAVLGALWDLEPQERLPFYGAAKPPTPAPIPEPAPTPIPMPAPIPALASTTPVVVAGVLTGLATALVVASANVSSLFRGIFHVLFGS